MSPDHLKETLRTIPDSPGVYKYYDKAGELIYIGKAKSLKKRVDSYFNKVLYENFKTRLMVGKIEVIEFTLVDTEMDALLLENLLIKQFKPRYNILLKDDKTYPFIVITNERFPKIFPTRKYIKDGSDYFGPYTSGTVMHTLLDLVKATYPIRNCNLILSEKNIEAKKFRICLEYQIGNCKGPCEGLQSEDDYLQTIAAIKNILKGNVNEVLTKLKEEMQKAATALKYEDAHFYKTKIDRLADYQSRSTIVSRSVHNVDVFNIAVERNYAFVNFLRVVNGMIIQTQTVELRKQMEEPPEELLLAGMAEIWARYGMTAKEVVVPFNIELESGTMELTLPKVGDKKKLLDLSLKNVLYFKKEKLEQYEKVNPEVRTDRILAQMRQDLRLAKPPKRIDCFDNSNIQGAFPVSAMVCFIDAKPAKKEYRHYNVKTVEGPNDFATMYEVIYRRYSRMQEEQLTPPDLIIVDGGKGQLSSACEALKSLGLYGKIPIIGIAKRLEELYYPSDDIPLYIDKKSETLKIIQQLRDEAHRFGITHHRKRRDKGTILTGLEGIEGIGPTTAQKLLRTFKSVKKIKEAKLEDLVLAVGESKAKMVWKGLGNTLLIG
ncbi:MAG: excinuclease ABC subunit C [Flavobacteriaceae bacterium]|nr:excinuclease ABC subunit C [Flavobacteriaceae bacterium]